MNIDLPEGAEEKLESGKTVFLAAGIYDAEEDSLHYYFPTNMTTGEGIAMLQKFKCFAPCH